MSETDYASIIKSSVSCRDMLERMGVSVNRAGFAICPFHHEKTASLKVYEPSTRGWYCHACHAGGDVIDMARLWYGTDFRGAMDRLNEEFSLGLPIGQPLTPEQREQMRRERNQRERDRQRRKRRVEAAGRAYNAASDAYRENERLIDQTAPEGPLDDWSDAFCEALKRRDTLLYELEYTEERWREARARREDTRADRDERETPGQCGGIRRAKAGRSDSRVHSGGLHERQRQAL